MTPQRVETLTITTTIKAGDPVDVINPRTKRPMTGKWTFRALVVTEKAESAEVFGGAPGKEKLRSFTVEQIKPKGY